MALTAAERAKRYRERKKQKDEVRAEYLRKERDGQRNRNIPISERSDRDKRKIRKCWRRNQKAVRVSRQMPDPSQAQLQTPPATPEPGRAAGNPHRPSLRLARSKPKAYREIQHLRYKLSTGTKRAERFKKRLWRERAKHIYVSDSPNSMTRRQVVGAKKHACIPAGVRKTLLFYNVLISHLRQKYRCGNGEHVKRTLSQLMRGSILKKYRMIEHARRALASFVRKRETADGPDFGYQRRKRSDKISDENKQTIARFFERDDNSRMMPGKKDTITRGKVKKQKRLLCDSMKVLHPKCLSENPGIHISYASFCSLRPFWVVSRKLSDRNTCLCKRHDKMQLIANKLHREKVIATPSLSDQYQLLVCDTSKQECMYGICSTCTTNTLHRIDTRIADTVVTYQQWATKQEERFKATAHGEEKIQVKVTSKESISGPMSDLYRKFESDLKPTFTTHVFNIKHQYASIWLLRESLDEDEVVVHVDFSENYSCKSYEEIQSVHFGASHKQATLHTGVAYMSHKTISFCTISNSTRHDPAAIWAHLLPVLAELIRLNPLTTVHFISDGPTTQYRNKKNFYFASVLPFELGFWWVTWNFLEAGHGKGAADGIGGGLKRTADRLVSEGKDITDGESLYRALLPDSSIKLILVEDEDIRNMDGRLPKDLRPLLQGTMKFHQLCFSVKESGTIWHRVLSCFCAGTKSRCECFRWSETKVEPKPPTPDIRKSPQRYSSQGNYNTNNAYKWYGGGYRGGDRGGSNREVTFRDTFSTNNRFEALSQQEAKQNRPKVNSGLLSFSSQDILNTIAADMETWEQTNTWHFSCYNYFKDGSCIPGLDDLSPEELRFEAYEAEKSGSGPIYVQKTKDLLNKYRQLRSELARPSTQTKQKLIQVIEEDRKRLERGGPAPSSASTGLFTGSAFSQPPASGFAQSSQNVFNNSQQQTTGLFGKPATPANTLFGNSQSGNSGSIFGNTQSRTGSLFGGASVFGNNNQSGGNNVFGTNQSGGGSVFGTSQSGGSSVFGNSQSGASPFGSNLQITGADAAPSQPTGLFGKPAFGTSSNVQGSVFGNNPAPSTFGSGAAGKSLTGVSPFGQPVFGVSGSLDNSTGSATSQATSGASTGPVAPKTSMYTPLTELTVEERQQFEAPHFAPGRLPTRPPPKELC